MELRLSTTSVYLDLRGIALQIRGGAADESCQPGGSGGQTAHVAKSERDDDGSARAAEYGFGLLARGSFIGTLQGFESTHVAWCSEGMQILLLVTTLQLTRLLQSRVCRRP